MRHWIETLLTAPAEVPTCADVAQWWPQHRQRCLDVPGGIEQAILGGFAADRVAWAFASACQAALRALVPDLPGDGPVAFCVTEAEGNAPRSVRSGLHRSGTDGWILNGAKRWATPGVGSTTFLVVARDLQALTDLPALRVARVTADSAGLSVEAMAPTAFVPEVPHARLGFSNVAVPDDALLPGDGYALYVKPFRTVEDIYIQAAILSDLVREARRQDWPRTWIEEALATLAALAGIAALDPAASATHIVLAGAMASAETLARDADGYWQASNGDESQRRWVRDRALFGLASAARAQRLASAWTRTLALAR